MGLLSSLFSTPPNRSAKTTGDFADQQNPKGVDFSDNDEDLLKAINTEENVDPISRTLPFDTACPYCGVVFDKPVKRKKECPECKQVIYVRTTQTLYEHSALTKEQLAHAEFYERLRYDLGATKEDYKNAEAVLKKKWNRSKINTYDVLWSMYNSLELYQKDIDPEYDKKAVISEVLRKKQWMGFAAATYQARRGKDPKPYIEGAHHSAIQLAKLEEYVDGLTVQCPSCCDACMKFDKKTFSLEFVEKTPVLPVKICTRQCEDNPKYTYCVCTYGQHYNFPS